MLFRSRVYAATGLRLRLTSIMNSAASSSGFGWELQRRQPCDASIDPEARADALDQWAAVHTWAGRGRI
ncbi:unnamed protein product [Boreogadus saida]